jgi:hypothetical protein
MLHIKQSRLAHHLNFRLEPFENWKSICPEIEGFRYSDSQCTCIWEYLLKNLTYLMIFSVWMYNILLAVQRIRCKTSRHGHFFVKNIFALIKRLIHHLKTNLILN